MGSRFAYRLDVRIPAMSTLRYQQRVLVNYVLAIFMTVIDGTMVNVALPTMARHFGAGIFVSWFVRDDDVAETQGLTPVVARSGA